jgi:hypothetical protein
MRGHPTAFKAFHWHGDTFGFPDGARRLAESKACRNQAFSFGDRIPGLQLHWDVKQENIEEWIKSRSDKLVQESYVQIAQEMPAQKDQFAIIQKYMNKILDYFAARG